jgi:catechol 2,3-dioxygenase-like lactoylglutathione lyase family enzyme
MGEKIISGIQQIGIGIDDVWKAWRWYNRIFGTDIRVFEDKTTANLMLRYTGGVPQKRHAALAFNLQGGGGFEIWQYTDRKPREADFDVRLGDLGIFAAKVKCRDVHDTYRQYASMDVDLLGPPKKGPDGHETFFLKDPFGNLFQVMQGNHWYKNEKKPTGGAYGAVIGVTDIEESRKVYTDILGYDQVIYDQYSRFDDLSDVPGGNHSLRRVLLTHSQPRKGGFSPLLGDSWIELVQVGDRKPEKIYRNRYWGDPGFIHLCFDVHGMEQLKHECAGSGYAFTIDSNVRQEEGHSFDMGDAAGHFSYIEDPDGTLIEFVETHRVPILKKLGWYINLRKRDPKKPLPNWLIKAMSFNRVKFRNR